jgi:hypothetical protein
VIPDRIIVPWVAKCLKLLRSIGKIISKGIKTRNSSPNDILQSREKIQKLVEYPVRRIKPIALVMISSEMEYRMIT